MSRRRALRALIAACLALLGTALLGTGPGPNPAQATEPRRPAVVFEVCKHGCRFHTIQRAVDAAGSSPALRRGRPAVVAVRAGRYRENVAIRGASHPRLDGLTIEGTSRSARRVVVEGEEALEAGIEAVGVGGLTIRNLWVRNNGADGLKLRPAVGHACGGYRLENVLASGNRFDGVVAVNCPGGRIAEYAAWGQGWAGFHVSTTRKPAPTVLKDDRAWRNAIGYLGTNARYVRVVESAFFGNGLGIGIATVDGPPAEPAGWQTIERNAVFWNHYDPFLAGSGFDSASPTLGVLGAAPIHYPTGVGILLYGASHATVRHNDVFGNYKWGVAALSAPGQPFGPDNSLLANLGDDAKSVDNQVVENRMAREGSDPNGEFDFFADATGGGNCWGGNSPGARFAPGNGRVPLARIYPDCPQPEAEAAAVSSLDTAAGLQLDAEEETDPHTAIGYLTTSPPQSQECSWVRRAHPPFQGFESFELEAAPGEIVC